MLLYWELKVGVAINLPGLAQTKGDRLPRCMADTDNRPPRSTYLLNYFAMLFCRFLN